MELLVILAIVAILAVGSSMMMGSKQSGAVRSLIDELEGAVSNAVQAAVATGKDIAIVSWGDWENADSPFAIAFGDASLAEVGAGPDNFITIGKEVIAGRPPVGDTPVLDVSIASVVEQQTVIVPYQLLKSDAVQKRARVAVEGTDDWAKAKGSKNEDIASIVPFTTDIMKDVLVESNNLCTGKDSGISRIVYVSGATKRFNRDVFIRIVATNSNGKVIPDGPMGLIVLKENGAAVFKFYNPGADSGDGKWRRI